MEGDNWTITLCPTHSHSSFFLVHDALDESGGEEDEGEHHEGREAQSVECARAFVLDVGRVGVHLSCELCKK